MADQVTTSAAFKSLWTSAPALDKFVRTWKEHTDIHKMAEAYGDGLTADEASRAAAKLRKAGVALHNMTRGRRQSSALPVDVASLSKAYAEGNAAPAPAPAHAAGGKGKGK